MDYDASMRLQEELEPDFRAIAHLWESRGFAPTDIAEALLALGMARVEMVTANGETEAVISRARATVKQ